MHPLIDFLGHHPAPIGEIGRHLHSFIVKISHITDFHSEQFHFKSVQRSRAHDFPPSSNLAITMYPKLIISTFWIVVMKYKVKTKGGERLFYNSQHQTVEWIRKFKNIMHSSSSISKWISIVYDIFWNYFLKDRYFQSTSHVA